MHSETRLSRHHKFLFLAKVPKTKATVTIFRSSPGSGCSVRTPTDSETAPAGWRASPTRQLRVGLLPHFGKLWPRCHHWAQRKAPIAGCLLPGSPGTGVQQSQQGRLEGPGFQAPPRVSAHALAQEAAAPPTPGLSLFRDSICPGNESNIIH